ncbi:hypothetical protein GCM10027280_01470 [Micromonospora polyrhachis]
MAHIDVVRRQPIVSCRLQQTSTASPAHIGNKPMKAAELRCRITYERGQPVVISYIQRPSQEMTSFATERFYAHP